MMSLIKISVSLFLTLVPLLSRVSANVNDSYLQNPLTKDNVNYRGMIDCGNDDKDNLVVGLNDQGENNTAVYVLNLTASGESITFSTCWINVTYSNPDLGAIDSEYDTGLSVWKLNVGMVPEDDVTAELVAYNNDDGVEVCSVLTINTTSQFDSDYCYIIQLGSNVAARNQGGYYGLSMDCSGGYTFMDSCDANFSTSTELEMADPMTSTEYMMEPDSPDDTGDMDTTEMSPEMPSGAFARAVSFTVIALSFFIAVFFD